jgi:hypothetical protein
MRGCAPLTPSETGFKTLKKQLLLAGSLLLLAGALLVIPNIGAADPNLADVAAHRHFIVNSTGQFIPVGPDLCDNLGDPGIQQAFNEFHNNLHIATPSSIGPVAPGLHNGRGGELVARGCSFVPPS